MYQELTNLIEQVEIDLRKGIYNTNAPESALSMYTILQSYLSTCYGISEKKDAEQSRFFTKNREHHASDLATTKSWRVSDEGIQQAFWETRIKRLKVLIETLLTIYYKGRDDYRNQIKIPDGKEN